MESITASFFPDSLSDFISLMEMTLFDRGKKYDEAINNDTKMREEIIKFKNKGVMNLIKLNNDDRIKK